MDSFAVQMDEILTDYKSEVKDVARVASEKAAKETQDRLRAVTDPKLTGAYAKGWTITKQGPDTYVVHNKTKYRLTHLLENGHQSANQYGDGYGRVNGIKHIEPAEQEGIKVFVEEIERGLS